MTQGKEKAGLKNERQLKGRQGQENEQSVGRREGVLGT